MPFDENHDFISTYFDDDVSIWVAVGHGLLEGIITESKTLDGLFDRVKSIAPEIYRLNNTIPFQRALALDFDVRFIAREVED